MRESVSPAREMSSLIRESRSLEGEMASLVREKRFLIGLVFENTVNIADLPQGVNKMAKVKVKQIKERALLIQNAWNEGASNVTEFRNTKKTDFDAEIAAGQASEDRIADLKAQLAMEENNRDTIYTRINALNVDAVQGIRGHKDFGDDHPILTAIGLVRKSDRDSGLTREKKDKNDDDGEGK